MTTEHEASTSTEELKELNFYTNQDILKQVKLLREIGETIDSVLSIHLDSATNATKSTASNNNNVIENASSSSSQTNCTSRATSIRLSRPWACDVLDIVLNEKADQDPKAILRMHYQQCPWFYDTLNSCVSLPSYGGLQHELIDQYYQEPQLWCSTDEEDAVSVSTSLSRSPFKDYRGQICGAAKESIEDIKLTYGC